MNDCERCRFDIPDLFFSSFLYYSNFCCFFYLSFFFFFFFFVLPDITILYICFSLFLVPQWINSLHPISPTGWDISSMNIADAMQRARVLDYHLQQQLRPLMAGMKPRPSIYFPDFIAANQEQRADNVLKGTKQELLEKIREDIRDFQQSSGVEKVSGVVGVYVDEDLEVGALSHWACVIFNSHNSNNKSRLLQVLCHWLNSLITLWTHGQKRIVCL